MDRAQDVRPLSHAGDPILAARRYALRLLAELGVEPRRPLLLAPEHPAVSWARSGLMQLTGDPGGPPLMCPAALAACADGALAALRSLAADAGALDPLQGSRLLAERAAIAGHGRGGLVSPGGSCRLLAARDGLVALNLAREDDWELLPAWLECEVPAQWPAVALEVARRLSSDLVGRGRELGLAVAPSPDDIRGLCLAAAPSRGSPGPRGAAHEARGPRVVDLSSLWAGPLCGHLLQQLGADVVKVESLQRPDGARRGQPEFFDLLNAGKRSVALDFSCADGRAQLQALLRRADIVIEASRPRALRQLGIDAQAILAERPQLTWVSINGYGRDEPQSQWIAYGDDAGVAAGLSALMHDATGRHCIVGDAIADPLTGLHAALCAWAGWLQGGAGMRSLPLAAVVRRCLDFEPAADPRLCQLEWRSRLVADGIDAAAARARPPARRASALGADTGAVLRDWAAAC